MTSQHLFALHAMRRGVSWPSVSSCMCFHLLCYLGIGSCSFGIASMVKILVVDGRFYTMFPVMLSSCGNLHVRFDEYVVSM